MPTLLTKKLLKNAAAPLACPQSPNGLPASWLALACTRISGIGAVIDAPAGTLAYHHPISGHQFIQRCFHLYGGALNPLFQEPPLHDPFDGVLRVWILSEISQDFIFDCHGGPPSPV